MSVKRYRLARPGFCNELGDYIDDAEMIESENGDYVSHANYAALEAENAKLNEARVTVEDNAARTVENFVRLNKANMEELATLKAERDRLQARVAVLEVFLRQVAQHKDWIPPSPPSSAFGRWSWPFKDDVEKLLAEPPEGQVR